MIYIFGTLLPMFFFGNTGIETLIWAGFNSTCAGGQKFPEEFIE
jgi:hypothetical protein